MKFGRSAWKKAEEFGVDTTLLEENLRRSPTERIIALQNAVSLAASLMKAGTEYYAKLRKNNKGTAR